MDNPSLQDHRAIRQKVPRLLTEGAEKLWAADANTVREQGLAELAARAPHHGQEGVARSSVGRRGSHEAK